jgi:Fe-S-cluster-containing hydrogenase component 2
MSAVALAGGTARIDSQRCIGCGACIPTCAQHALALVHKPESISPPLTTDALYAAIGARKEGVLGKVKTGLRIVRPHKHRAS